MKILILNSNTKQESLSKELAYAYERGARKSGHETRLIHIEEMPFDPVLKEGYQQIQTLEPALEEFQKLVLWCEHFVIVYPTWWGGPPAILKGLFDRSFLPGFAFKYHTNDPFWDKLLKGRSAHLITTMDSPYLWNWLVYRNAGTNLVKRAILNFCGFSPVRTTSWGRTRYKSRKQLEAMLVKAESMGERGK